MQEKNVINSTNKDKELEEELQIFKNKIVKQNKFINQVINFLKTQYDLLDNEFNKINKKNVNLEKELDNKTFVDTIKTKLEKDSENKFSSFKLGRGRSDSFSANRDLSSELDALVENELIAKTKIADIKDNIKKIKKTIKNSLDKSIERLEEIVDLSEEDGVHNIILIGSTGSGKSTLANVLTNTNNFKESASSTSTTRDIQTHEFEYNKKKYRIIDTVGIGDTSLSQEEVLYKMSQATYLLRNGLTQVLFVTGGRFNDQEIGVYELLKGTIFDENITDYTTIVRTRFPDFESENECKKDKRAIIRENKALANVVTGTSELIHVDNSSAESRLKSREILLFHLENCQEIYKPQNIRQFINEIRNPMNEMTELAREKENYEKEINTVEERIMNGEREDESGQGLMQVMRMLIEKQTKTEENMIKLAEVTSEKASRYMKEQVEEKGLLVRWLEIVGDTAKEAKEVADVASRCQIM